MFDVTQCGDVFVQARAYDWLTKAGTLGGLARAYRRAALTVAEPGPRRMLDVGTGTGALAIALKAAAPAAEVHGVDPSARMLDLARTNGVRAGVVVHFTHGWAQDLPFPDAEFDLVTFASVLHHIPPTERAVALREARRVLRPDARALIIEWVPARIGRLLPLHRYQLDLDGCRRLLRASGFEDVRTGRLTRLLLGYALGRRAEAPSDRFPHW